MLIDKILYNDDIATYFEKIAIDNAHLEELQTKYSKFCKSSKTSCKVNYYMTLHKTTTNEILLIVFSD